MVGLKIDLMSAGIFILVSFSRVRVERSDVRFHNRDFTILIPLLDIIIHAPAAMETVRRKFSKYSGKFVLRTGPDLHQALSVRAMIEGESLNTFVIKTLKKGLSA